MATPYTKAIRLGGFGDNYVCKLPPFYELKYHIVRTPKYRGKVLAHTKVKDELRRIFELI